MKSAQLVKYGEGGVEIKNIPSPTAGEKKILVEIYAAGVNPFDWKLAKGTYEKMMPFPLPGTLGGDFSGVVKESRDIRFRVGEEVFGQAHIFSGGTGSFAEMALVETGAISIKPKKLTHIEAAAIPLTGASAIQALIESMKLVQGMKVLIHGGAGGIGTMAIQIAKHLGAWVATTASAEDSAYVKGLGADEVIDYTKTKFEDVIKDYDAVYDTVGGDTYKRSFKVLKKGGIIVSMLEAPDEALMKEFGVKAISQFTKITEERLTMLAGFVDSGTIKVNVDKTFSLDEASAALTYLETGHPKGKVVLKVR